MRSGRGRGPGVGRIAAWMRERGASRGGPTIRVGGGRGGGGGNATKGTVDKIRRDVCRGGRRRELTG